MVSKSQRVRSHHRHRAGAITLELLFVLPILALILAGLFEFTLLFSARGEVVEASRVAVRKATFPGATVEDVEAEVRRVLRPRFHDTLQVDAMLGEKSGDTVVVAVRVDMKSAAPDLLWPIGYRLKGRQLLSEMCMIRE